jgi:hypothetical protein
VRHRPRTVGAARGLNDPLWTRHKHFSSLCVRHYYFMENEQLGRPVITGTVLPIPDVL